jgi:hypothetical protein
VLLENQRANEESVFRAFEEKAKIWLLILQADDGSRLAGTLSQEWLSKNTPTSFAHRRWNIFGVLQDRIGKVPLVAPISIFLDEPGRQ